mmetsp:Transcript_5899/g.9571  ORF Transcript_5899/g.9571 Transcript_5899/m.9571 type:complete len:111 (-) Transcript_5899:247-579(-)
MVGFTSIEAAQEGEAVTFKAKKAGQSAGPAKIKRKPKPEAPAENPWANLGNAEDATINEDKLLQQSEQSKLTQKFCGDGDVMQGAKPCANCSCGLKEKLEGNQTVLVDEK